MFDRFEFAGGSTAGRSHRFAGKNNQDALCCLKLPGCAVAVVCDGCGSGRQSEVGAQLGAPLVVQALGRCLTACNEIACSKSTLEDSGGIGVEAVLEQVRSDVLEQLLGLARGMGEDVPCVVNDYFLFTVVGVFLTRREAVFFSLGDGLLVINGRLISLGPFPDNAPPYLAYGLVPDSLQATPDALRFQVQKVMPTREVQSFLIGTDGVGDLIQAAGRRLPGKNERIGALEQFWQQDRYFANPDMIRRRLAAINRDAVTVEQGRTRREAGLLADDTTLIVGRRRADPCRPDEAGVVEIVEEVRDEKC